MSTNLATMMLNDVRGDTLNRIASALGETTAKTQSALSGILPAILSSLANKASSDEGASDLLDVIHQNKLDTEQFSNAAGAVSTTNGITNLMNVGKPLLNSIFGGRASALTEWVSSFSGLKSSSSSTLISLAMPMVLGFISRNVRSMGGSARNLVNLLSDQKASLLSEAPAGLANVLGLPETAKPVVGTYEHETIAKPPVVGTYEAERARPVVGTYAPEAPKGSFNWLWALLLIPLLGLLAYWLLRPTPKVEVQAPVRTAPAPVAATPAPVRAALSAFIERQLPDGTLLRIASNSEEAKLLAFIEDPSRVVDKTTRFNFAGLEFDTASSLLSLAAQERVNNIAGILKLFPNVNLKIGGHTDNVGEPASNLRLSQDRANNTMNAILAQGIAPGRLAAEGYAEQFPVADNSTEEGRQRNRRIDVRVSKK